MVGNTVAKSEAWQPLAELGVGVASAAALDHRLRSSETFLVDLPRHTAARYWWHRVPQTTTLTLQ